MNGRLSRPEFIRSFFDFNKHLFFLFCLLSGMGILLMSACGQSNCFNGNEDDPETVFKTVDDKFEPKIDPENLPSREPGDCPGLDSQLYQLIQKDDPQLSASEIGMNVKENKIQVLIILESEATDFLLDYDVELGTQAGNQVQAYVSFDCLCALANLDAVLAIRPVDRFSH